MVHSQDGDDEDDDDGANHGEPTTIPISTTVINVRQQQEHQMRTNSLLLSNVTSTNRASNISEQDANRANSSEPTKQRIIVALAVLCAALAVLLGFLISIVVCQWLDHDKNGTNDLKIENGKSQTNFTGLPDNYYRHGHRQTVKL
ncbi:unnamed protein product [Adineta ricciae]|uniref:Uncharacterized protein n=1 Tax=Adineta ricciae TaxID=249248 RepID=A0A814PF19_ADIRI|nr:unnamed protein product [Adineta ricciae]